MGKLFSLSVPVHEIHLSNEPVAIMLFNSGAIKFYKMHKASKYFVLNDGKFKGIYKINSKYARHIGKTTCYFFVYDEHNTVDPVLIDEINKYRKKNKLTQLKLEHVKQGSKMRIFMKKHDKNTAQEILETVVNEKQKEIRNAIQDGLNTIEATTNELTTKHNKKINLGDPQKCYILLKTLLNNGNIDEEEYGNLTNKISNSELSFDQLIEVLQESRTVSISEPLDENTEDFIQDLGSQNPRELAGFCQDLVNVKRGLRDMTAKPIKSFIPAAYILVGGLLLIFLAILIGNGTIPLGDMLGNFKVPFMGFLKGLF